MSEQMTVVATSPLADYTPAAGAADADARRFVGGLPDVPVGIYRTSADGRVLMANPAMLRMLGYDSFEELAGRDLEDGGFEPAYQRARFKERLERDGEIRGLESEWVRRDG